MAKDYTTYYNLVKPAPGSYDWDGDANDNFDTIDSTLNSLATGSASIVDGAVEDNFASFDANGDIQDSGYSDASYEDAGTMTTHEGTYAHDDLHTRLHSLAGSDDHSALDGAVEDDFITIDDSGLPKASGIGLVLTVGAVGSDAEVVSEQGIREAITTHETNNDHTDLHTRDHGISDTDDHDGFGGVLDNFVAFDANGLFKDSGHKDTDYSDSDHTHATLHTRDHGINSTSDHDGAGGTEDNFITFNSDGLFKDSGLALVTTVGDPGSDSSVPTEQAVREVLHDRDHGIDDTADHDGVSGATENNLISFDANALPKDSGLSLATTVGDPGVDTKVVSEQGIREALHDRDHGVSDTADHDGVAGAVTNNFVSFNADDLFQDSGYSDASYADADHDATHITGGSDEIDGDKLDIDWNPTNYTPATTPGEVTSVDHLTAHLYGIDVKLTNIDISSDTNLTATAPILLTGDDISFDYTNIAGYNAANTQVLAHVTGTLTWIDTDTCP